MQSSGASFQGKVEVPKWQNSPTYLKNGKLIEVLVLSSAYLQSAHGFWFCETWGENRAVFMAYNYLMPVLRIILAPPLLIIGIPVLIIDHKMEKQLNPGFAWRTLV